MSNNEETMKRWQDIVKLAPEFVGFLERDVFFDKLFVNTIDALVITDAEVGWQYAHGQEDDQPFPEWEDIIRGDFLFPDNFEFYDSINYGLIKNHHFNIEQKDFSGVNELWDNNIPDKMMMDIAYIFYCYANNYFLPPWKDILTAYLNNGLPCGWSDFPPKGKLVVFSNE